MQAIDSAVLALIQALGDGEKIAESAWNFLVTTELADSSRARAFGLNQDNCRMRLEARSHLLKQADRDLNLCLQALEISRDKFQKLTLIWHLWLPLAIQIASKRQALQRNLIQGILGGQGVGKSTLAKILSLLLTHLGYQVATISIDDLYLTYAERQKLKAIEPDLIWRGPPGTHDVNLGIEVLDQCLETGRTEPIWLPRFDKSAYAGQGDRTSPQAINSVDIVLFEGWFIGVQPVAESSFQSAPEPISNPTAIEFAIKCNHKLKDYLSLWSRLDSLLVIYPEDYRLSKQWRLEAEQKMIATGKTGMSDREIEQFVDYFWCALHPELFITPLLINPQLVDLVIEINSDRQISKIFQPN